MSIQSFDALIAAARQQVNFIKTATRTTVAAVPFSVFDLAGNPGAGTLAGGNTANGVVPNDTTSGTPGVNSFGGGNTGYLAAVDFYSTVASWLFLYDLVFKAGQYAYNAGNTSLTSQPSYSGRMPLGTDYSNTLILLECSTAFTSGTTWSVTVGYTNQAGTTGRSTGAITPGVAQTLGRVQVLPLQAGDSGVQKIESVNITTGNASAGGVNILVARQLWAGRVPLANSGDTHGPDKTGLPQLFDTSALMALVQADSTSSGIFGLLLDIVNG